VAKKGTCIKVNRMDRSSVYTYRRWKARTGFTLIEVMLAMTIFAIGILALGTLQVRYVSGNALARTETEALTMATDLLERLKSMPFDHSDLDPGSYGPYQRRGYEVTWDVTGDMPLNGIKTVLVRVQPRGRNARTLTLRYYLPEATR